jgi:hypothetical protein
MLDRLPLVKPDVGWISAVLGGIMLAGIVANSLRTATAAG